MRKKILKPKIGKRVFVDPSAQIIGQVKIGDDSSIWPGCVLRGDIQKIIVGHHSNIQDLSVIHVESNLACVIGNYVTVGHSVVLHACTVKDQSLIGIGSIVLDGAVVESGVILGAGSLVTHNQRLEAGSLYFGRPAKKVRDLSKKEIAGLKSWAKRYVRYASQHQQGLYHRAHPA